MKKKEVIQLINDYWKFDNDQDNLSTWHDKQDLISEIEKLTLTDVVGTLCEHVRGGLILRNNEWFIECRKCGELY